MVVCIFIGASAHEITCEFAPVIPTQIMRYNENTTEEKNIEKITLMMSSCYLSLKSVLQTGDVEFERSGIWESGGL